MLNRYIVSLSLCLLLCVLLPATQAGCGRSILSFMIAAGSLIRPVMDLELASGENGNMRRIFNRIRWMEQLREWEVRLQAHALSNWLGTSRLGRLKRCEVNCSSCFSGDISVGEIALPCWTQRDGPSYDLLQNEEVLKNQLSAAGLSGILKLEVPTLSKVGGEGFMTWDQVCYPAARLLDSSVEGMCVSGLSGYKVELNDEVDPTRQDSLWVVRVNIEEGLGGQTLLTRRLDGVMGILFKQRGEPLGGEPARRKAVLVEEKNALYQNFQISYCQPDNRLPGYRDCCGSVNILAADGEFSCAFIGPGVPAANRNTCWPANLTSVASTTINTFEVRCAKK